jgi:hypothetical protein
MILKVDLVYQTVNLPQLYRYFLKKRKSGATYRRSGASWIQNYQLLDNL